MIAEGARRRYLYPIAAALATAFLASGCLWGVVRDAKTGAGVSGATVSYTDSQGQTGSTKTNAVGLYVFDQAKGDPVPAVGSAVFEVSAPGYAHTPEPHPVEYDDNPGASYDNLSSFWEIQNFYVMPLTPTPTGEEGLTADLAVTDLFPGSLPQGSVFTRITNHGPDGVRNAHVELWCAYTAHGDRGESTPSVTLREISVTLRAGQTDEFKTGIAINTEAYWYEVVCQITVPFDDPDLANNEYAETIPEGRT